MKRIRNNWSEHGDSKTVDHGWVKARDWMPKLSKRVVVCDKSQNLQLWQSREVDGPLSANWWWCPLPNETVMAERVKREPEEKPCEWGQWYDINEWMPEEGKPVVLRYVDDIGGYGVAVFNGIGWEKTPSDDRSFSAGFKIKEWMMMEE